MNNIIQSISLVLFNVVSTLHRCVSTLLGSYIQLRKHFLAKCIDSVLCEPWAVQGLMTYLILSASFVRQSIAVVVNVILEVVQLYPICEISRSYKMHGSLSAQQNLPNL